MRVRSRRSAARSSPLVTHDLCFLGRVDKRNPHRVLTVIQAGICDGDQLGT
jgi:hypothetical protein